MTTIELRFRMLTREELSLLLLKLQRVVTYPENADVLGALSALIVALDNLDAQLARRQFDGLH